MTLEEKEALLLKETRLTQVVAECRNCEEKLSALLTNEHVFTSAGKVMLAYVTFSVNLFEREGMDGGSFFEEVWLDEISFLPAISKPVTA